MLDALGHLGYVFLFLGIGLLAVKERSGFIFRLIGEGIWIVVGFALGMSSIVVWGFVFCAIDVWGYRKWKESGL